MYLHLTWTGEIPHSFTYRVTDDYERVGIAASRDQLPHSMFSPKWFSPGYMYIPDSDCLGHSQFCGQAFIITKNHQVHPGKENIYRWNLEESGKPEAKVGDEKSLTQMA